jgi:hypothetical protein
MLAHTKGDETHPGAAGPAQRGLALETLPACRRVQAAGVAASTRPIGTRVGSPFPAAPQEALFGRRGSPKSAYVPVPTAALRAWFPELPAPVSLGFEVGGVPWKDGERIGTTIAGWAAAVGGAFGGHQERALDVQ